jgi:hypothetical protein
VPEAASSDAYSLLVEPGNLAEKILVCWTRSGNRSILAYPKRFAWVSMDRLYNENMKVTRTLLPMARSE